MKPTYLFLFVALIFIGGLWLYGTFIKTPRPLHHPPAGTTSPGSRRVEKTDEEWKSLLTRAQYHITRERGTEWPNSSELNHEHRTGTYACVCCRNPLFSSATKFAYGLAKFLRTHCPKRHLHRTRWQPNGSALFGL